MTYDRRTRNHLHDDILVGEESTCVPETGKSERAKRGQGFPPLTDFPRVGVKLKEGIMTTLRWDISLPAMKELDDVIRKLDAKIEQWCLWVGAHCFFSNKFVSFLINLDSLFPFYLFFSLCCSNRAS